MVQPIPEATVARLPLYLRALVDLDARGEATISSVRLADLAGVSAANLRKDLSRLGSYGTRGVGYEVGYLLHQIRHALGLDHDWSVVIAGAGNLGRALIKYRGFAERGFPVIAVFDNDPAKVGTEVAGFTVIGQDELPGVVEGRKDVIGVVAVPAADALAVVELMVGAGVRSILNFAPVNLSVPDGVAIRKVDLALEMQVLSYYGHQLSS